MIDEIRDMTGEVRRFGWKAPDPPHLAMRAARSNIQSMYPLIPRSEWREVDFVTPFGPQFINDQKSTSACTGFSAAQGMMRQRAIRGQKFVKLSGSSVYARINGGGHRDDGSNIIDSMNTLQSHGACLESEMPLPELFEDQIPATATWYREDVAITLANSDECATALLMGIIPQVPISVGSNFERFVGPGVASLSNASQGNHSVHLAGLKQINGIWYFLMPNSWGTGWGPFVNSNPTWAGCCLLTMQHVDACDYAEDGYGHGSTLDP